MAVRGLARALGPDGVRPAATLPANGGLAPYLWIDRPEQLE